MACHLLVANTLSEPMLAYFRSDPPSQRRHNECDGVSNRRRPDCLLNRLFRRRSKQFQSSALLAFVRRIQGWPVDSPHKGPVTRKMCPFDDVIMQNYIPMEFDLKFKSFIHENSYEMIVYKLAVILSGPQCGNSGKKYHMKITPPKQWFEVVLFLRFLHEQGVKKI